MDGVLILPGFGKRGFEGKVICSEYTRQNSIPTFGICYGMQAMVVQQARSVGIKDANSAENVKKGTFVIDIIRDKNDKEDLGGTLRLGTYTTILTKNSLAAKSYQADIIKERHRHRYEVNPNFIKQLTNDNFSFSGFDQKTNLAEICEVKKHPFYLGTQYHPEFNAKPLKPSNLFTEFIKSMIKQKYSVK
jgi:CTP synthase